MQIIGCDFHPSYQQIAQFTQLPRGPKSASNCIFTLLTHDNPKLLEIEEVRQIRSYLRHSTF